MSHNSKSLLMPTAGMCSPHYANHVCFSLCSIGHVLNEQRTGYEHIFSWYKHSVSIELKMGHVIRKSMQKLVNLPNLIVIGLNAKAW